MVKGRYLVTIGAAAVCAAVGIWAANYDLNQTQTHAVLQQATGIVKTEPAEEQQEAAAEEVEQGTPVDPVLRQSNGPTYRLGASQGRLAVFVQDSPDPEMVLDVYLSSLPQADQILLQQGIVTQSYAELVSMIEDYIS
jgi:type VI protein secretion system component VasK